MGLKDVRVLLVDALESGRYQHQARQVMSQKNLLATDDVSAAEVVALLHRCRGDQYTTSPLHFDPATTCHIFQPCVRGERWYIKAYFLSLDAVFISVHRTEH
ncbi:MAG TPA: hypothetical protein VF665_16410 [Longimicrobium sp.]|uniref:hypothetical protein n=1 Tax=Longimicrobium sp. TaxID=2029185 RepID=UPI002ED9A6C2